MPALRRPIGHRLPLLVAALTAVLWAQAVAPSASACSCVGPQPMAAYATDPRSSVLTGVPGPLSVRGVPVQVTRWFKGPGIGSVVWLSAGSFGNEGASCERMPPTVGVELILVLYMPEDGSDPSGSICTPMATLTDVEGRAMLADAVATFGSPVGPLVLPGSEVGTEPLEVLLGLVPAIAFIGAGAVLLAAVIVGLARLGRSRAGGTPTAPPGGPAT